MADHEVERLDIDDKPAVAALDRIQQKAAQVDRSLTVIVDQGARGGVALGDAFTRGGRGILEVSRLVEDLQFGLSAAVNNVPGVITAFAGFSPVAQGVAGAVSLVLVGAQQLYRNWDDLTGLFQQPHTEDEAARMDRLAASTHRTAEETKELNKYKREQAELEKLLSTPSKAESQAAKTVQENVAQVGGPAVEKALTEGIKRFEEAQHLANPPGAARKPEPTAIDRFADEHLSDTGKKVADFLQSPFREATPDPAAEAKAQEEARTARARELLGKAAAGDRKAAEQIQGYLGQLPEGQRPALDFLSPKGPTPSPLPAGLTPQEQEDYRRQQKADAEKADREKEAKAKEEAKAAKDHAEKLNVQGLENESAGVAAQKKADEEYRKETERLNAAGEKYEEETKKELVKDAKEQGADILAGAGAKAGGNADQISQLLQARHLDKATADALAEDAVKGEGRSQLEKLFGGEKSRSSVVLGGGAALSEAIQTSVGAGGEDQKQTRLLERIEGHFAALRQQPPGQRDFVFRR